MISKATVLETLTPLNSSLNHPFLEEFIEQFRQQDTTGQYQFWSDEELLDSLVVSPTQKYAFEAKSSHRSPNSLISLQITAFYQTVAQLIEEKTGKISQVFVNLSSKGLSSVLIFCGNLLVTYELLMKLSEFSFDSLETFIKTGEILVHNASLRVQKFF